MTYERCLPLFWLLLCHATQVPTQVLSWQRLFRRFLTRNFRVGRTATANGLNPSGRLVPRAASNSNSDRREKISPVKKASIIRQRAG